MKLNKIKIRESMGEKKMSVKDLADIVGVRANNLSTVLTRGTCRPETAINIAKGLGLSLSELTED